MKKTLSILTGIICGLTIPTQPMNAAGIKTTEEEIILYGNLNKYQAHEAVRIVKKPIWDLEITFLAPIGMVVITITEELSGEIIFLRRCFTNVETMVTVNLSEAQNPQTYGILLLDSEGKEAFGTFVK